jgi:hypothetical protein
MDHVKDQVKEEDHYSAIVAFLRRVFTRQFSKQRLQMRKLDAKTQNTKTQRENATRKCDRRKNVIFYMIHDHKKKILCLG